MSSIHRDYIQIPEASGRFWCVDTAFIEEEELYETMVFDAVKMPENSPYIFDVDYSSCNDFVVTSSIDEAYENHRNMIVKWSTINRKEGTNYGQRAD